MQVRSNLIWNILKTSSPLEKQIASEIETNYGCVSYNILEIATEYNNALSQTPAIHGRPIFILEVPLLK
jgi:hypothetical protein